ncbi:hypothetical protein Bhyg_08034 [Pseudolycoriella hygida]|uniref:Uncharacterized protein n=1 Tax=Pseudolycoriella hygida TaxID=35572 RepID=A0A9Q0S3Y1_9DIPT|nr:hypothetical protein Bhyg_08034 [Pseudolycoriella hygida]
MSLLGRSDNYSGFFLNFNQDCTENIEVVTERETNLLNI